MKVKRRSPITGRIFEWDIPVTKEQIERWRQGELIQRAMPNLSADQREFIMTGITPDEWDEMFRNPPGNEQYVFTGNGVHPIFIKDLEDEWANKVLSNSSRVDSNE